MVKGDKIGQVLTEKEGPQPESQTLPPPGEGVIDVKTYRNIEGDELYKTLNNCKTSSDETIFAHSLSNPLTDLSEIEAKQDSLKELEENEELKQDLEEYLESVAQYESQLYKMLIKGRFLRKGTNLHQQYRKVEEEVENIVNGAEELPDPNSPYLQEQIESIEKLWDTYTFDLIEDEIYHSFKDKEIKLGDEKERWDPSIKFQPQLVKNEAVGVYGSAYILAGSVAPFNLSSGLILSLIPSGIIGLTSIFIEQLVAEYDTNFFLGPLSEIASTEEQLYHSLESIGKIDELLSFNEYEEQFPWETTLPDIEESDRHFLRLKEAKNPVMGARDINYVPSDIELDDLNFLTGGNSGGKTATCKTVAQSQLLSQIGSYIPAEDAELSPADQIWYQVPNFNRLNIEGNGRFEAEGKRQKEIISNSTPKSLVILDELIEATGREEKMDISQTILNGYLELENTTLLVTHNRELVRKHTGKDRTKFLKVTFEDEEPTYKLEPGISESSRAHKVAEKIGLTEEEINRIVKEAKEENIS